jgi:ADP-ribose pyrophosphatase
MKMNFPELFHYGNYRVLKKKENSIFVEDLAPASAAVVTVYEGRLILVKQWRAAIGSYTIELPGGGLEEGENPEDGARRELLEETGLKCAEIHLLSTFHPQPYFTNRFSYLFFTNSILEQGSQSLDEDEKVTVESYAVSDVLDEIRLGNLQDSELAYGLFIAQLSGLIEP